jgi:type II secretory pathway pseudopilin PulG
VQVTSGRFDGREVSCRITQEPDSGTREVSIAVCVSIPCREYHDSSVSNFHVPSIRPHHLTNRTPQSVPPTSYVTNWVRVKEEPSSPPPPSSDSRRRPAPMLLTSTTHKNIGLAILSPGLPPRATTDPDSRKQLVEADAIRAQQQAIIDQRRNAGKPPPSAGQPATPGVKKPKTLSGNARSTKRARAPPNITIDGSAGKSNPDLSIQSAPLYPPRGTLFDPRGEGNTGPVTSALYRSRGEEYIGFTPYPIPPRRNHEEGAHRGWLNGHHQSGPPEKFKAPTRPSPPRLPSLASQFSSSTAAPPPTPSTPSNLPPTKFALKWFEGKFRKRSMSELDASSSEDESMETVRANMDGPVTLTRAEWMAKGYELLELTWLRMVRDNRRGRARARIARLQQQEEQAGGERSVR